MTSFTIATRVLAFVFKIYLSRTVGAEVIGLYHIALSIFGMLTCITASGIPLTLSRKTAEYSTSGKKDAIPAITTSSIITGILASIVIVIIIFIFRGNIEFLFKDPRALPLFFIMLPALISTALYSIMRGWFWGMKDFTSFSVGELLEELLRIIFTILLAGGIISTINGAMGLALAFTLADIICAVVMVILFKRKGGKLKPPKETLSLLKSSTPITAMRLFTGIVSMLTAIIIPAKLTLYGMTINEATAAFGRVVGLAFPLIIIPLSLTNSITVVLIPEVSGQNALGNTKGISTKIDKAITLSVAITGLFLAMYIAFGREIGIIIYDDIVAGEFVKAGAWMMILIIINQITGAVLNSIAMEYTAFFNYAIGTVILLFLIIYLPQFIGIYALIVANGIFYLITLIFNIISLYRKDAIKIEFIKNSFITIIFAIPSAFVARSFFLLFAYNTPLIISVGISGVFLSVMYCLMVAVSGIIDIDYFYISKFNKKMGTTLK